MSLAVPSLGGSAVGLVWDPDLGEQATSMDTGAFSPPSQLVPCFSVSLPLWENRKSVKFPSLSPEHFTYQGAKLGTEPPLTRLMNDSVFSGQLLPAHCLTVMPSCVGAPGCPRCYATLCREHCMSSRGKTQRITKTNRSSWRRKKRMLAIFSFGLCA